MFNNLIYFEFPQGRKYSEATAGETTEHYSENRDGHVVGFACAQESQ
jgi:hypothetical protein